MILFGISPFSSIDLNALSSDLSNVSAVQSVLGYLYAETDLITGKNLHSDLLRVLVHYGLVGLIAFMRIIYSIFSFSPALMGSVLIMLAFSSIYLAFPCFLFLLLLIRFASPPAAARELSG